MKWKDLTPGQASDLIIELHDLFYRPESPTWKRWVEDNWGYPAGMQVLWGTTAGHAMQSMSNACSSYSPKPKRRGKRGGKKKPLDTAPNWDRQCSNCGETPIMPDTGMCGPCTTGEASTAGGNW